MQFLKEGFLTNVEWRERIKPFLNGKKRKFSLVFLRGNNFIYCEENYQVFLCKIEKRGIILVKIDSTDSKQEYGISLGDVVRSPSRKNLKRKDYSN